MRLRFAWRQTCLSAAPLMATSAAARAADPVFQAPAPIASPSGPQTLTGDWFGQGPALREAGFDFRLEWSQFYQGLTQGEGDKSWQYGGKFDALARVEGCVLLAAHDLARELPFWRAARRALRRSQTDAVLGATFAMLGESGLKVMGRSRRRD
jgi:hypothetical protein